MHLVDHARTHIERTYRRPWQDRALRALLAFVLPYPARFRAALLGARLARPLRGLLPEGRLRASSRYAPGRAFAARAAPSGRASRARDAAGARRPARRLRAAGAGARNKRRHDPAADAARRRGRHSRGRRLLRRADPSHGPPRRGDRECPRRDHGLRARDRGRGAGRGDRQHVGLRHDAEGLRVFVSHRGGRFARARRAGGGAVLRHLASSSCASATRPAGRRRGCASPTIPRAASSTASA